MKTFYIDVYDTRIDVLVFEDVKESDKHILKINKKYKIDYELGKFEGQVIEINKRHYQAMFIRQYIADNVIAHECYHLTEMIGEASSLSTEGFKEDRAYLNGKINEKVRGILKIYLEKSK
jgi:hypothetical protein